MYIHSPHAPIDSTDRDGPAQGPQPPASNTPLLTPLPATPHANQTRPGVRAASALCRGLTALVLLMSSAAMAADGEARSGEYNGPAQGKQPYVLGETLPSPNRSAANDGAAAPADAAADAQSARTKSAPSSEAYRPLDWAELIPSDWEPLKDFQVLDFDSMSDSDPRAIAALKKLQAAWKNAPLNPAIKDEAIEISGFIVPLDNSKADTIEEMLLVPYFGACIHVPPPPSNQVIHVVMDKPLKGFQMMDPVTVRGRLKPSRTDTPYGSSGYQLQAQQVSAYEEPAEQPLEEHP